MTIDNTWTFYVPDTTGEAAAVAGLLASGELLMGCEDEFPSPTGIVQPSGSIVFGSSAYVGELATNGAGNVIALATYDELSSLATASSMGLSSAYGFDQSWWDTIDDGATNRQEAQAYLIAYLPPGQFQDEKILIVGGSQAGLQYGVIDFLKSVDRVQFDHGGTLREWKPDPDSSLASLSECTDDNPTVCGAFDAACWSSGAWTPVTEVEWCPEEALSYPDVSLRMGFPAFGGGNFLPYVFNKQFGACTTSGADWFDSAVVDCDRHDVNCQAAAARLDALVWGKYNFALDESLATWQSDGLEYRLTPSGGSLVCTADELYDAAWEYLRQRRVLLVPTAFGLESRTAEEPVGGAWMNDGRSWRKADWGREGNFTHAEGLSVIQKPFKICEWQTDTGASTQVLMPVPESDYLDASVDACDYLDEASGAVNGPIQASATVDFDAALPGATNSWTGTSTCWLPSSDLSLADDAFGPFGAVNSDNCQLRLDLDTEADGRLLNVHYQALIAKGTDEVGLDAELVLEDSAGTVLERMEISFGETTTDYYRDMILADGASTSDPAWVHFNTVVRVPRADIDGDGVDDIAKTTLKLKGQLDTSSSSSLVWLDELQVEELDGLLRNIDVDSVQVFDASGDELDPSCFTVYADVETVDDTSLLGQLPAHFEEDSSTDADALGWHPVLKTELDTGLDEPVELQTDYAGRIEVDSATCPLRHPPATVTLAEGDLVYVSYRAWTHGGTWPKVKGAQESYVYAPNVFASDYWADHRSPTSQMGTLVTDLGHGPASPDPDKHDAFILVSDLGGEIRGFNRAWANEAMAENSEKFASYYCKLKEGLCDEGLGDSGCGFTCDPMFNDPNGSSWAPCDCSASGEVSPRLLIAADMFALTHNGARELYQVPYGGRDGASMLARDTMPADTVFSTWWHYDSMKAGSAVGGQEMAAGLVEDLTGAGFDVIGAPSADPDNQRLWAAFAAREQDPEAANIIGVAHYGWGGDVEGPEYMAQTGHYSWQSEWALLDHWFLSHSSDLPGGNEQFEWNTAGAWALGAPIEDELARPAMGKWLRTSGPGAATWTSPWVELDLSQLPAPDWLYTSVGWKASWTEPWVQLLLRFYARLPDPSCDIEPTLELRAANSTGIAVQTAALTPDPSGGQHPGGNLKVFSARAGQPALWLHAQDLTGLEARASLAFSGCTNAVLDSPALYQGISWIDFPTAYQEKTIGVDWTDATDQDATKDVCGSSQSCNCQAWGPSPGTATDPCTGFEPYTFWAR